MVVRSLSLRRSLSTSSLMSSGSASARSSRSIFSNSVTSVASTAYQSSFEGYGPGVGASGIDPELESLAMALQERLEEEGRIKERSSSALLFGGIKIPNAFVGSEACTILQELLQERKEKERKQKQSASASSIALHFVTIEERSCELDLSEKTDGSNNNRLGGGGEDGIQVVTREEALLVGNKIAKEFGFFKRVTALSSGKSGDEPEDEDNADGAGAGGIGISSMLQKKTKMFHLTDSKTDHYQFHNNLPSQVMAMKQQYKTYWDKMRLMEEHVECKDRWYFPRVYQDCFVAKDAVDTLMQLKIVRSRGEAVHLVRKLNQKVFCCQHVCTEHEFKDEYLFFRFVPKHERMPEPIRSKSKDGRNNKKSKTKKSLSPKRTKSAPKPSTTAATTTTTGGSLQDATAGDADSIIKDKSNHSHISHSSSISHSNISHSSNSTNNSHKRGRVPRNSIESSHLMKIRLGRCAKSLSFDEKDKEHDSNSNNSNSDNNSHTSLLDEEDLLVPIPAKMKNQCNNHHGSNTSLNTAPSLLGDSFGLLSDDSDNDDNDDELGPDDFLEKIASGGVGSSCGLTGSGSTGSLSSTGKKTKTKTRTKTKLSSSSSAVHLPKNTKRSKSPSARTTTTATTATTTTSGSTSLSPKIKSKSTGNLLGNLTRVNASGRRRANDIRARLANHHQVRIQHNKKKLQLIDQKKQLLLGSSNGNSNKSATANLTPEQRKSLLAAGRKSLEKARTELIGITPTTTTTTTTPQDDDDMPLPYHKNSMMLKT